MTTIVTTRGQVTIPKRLRDHLGMHPGTAVDFEITADGRVFLVKAGAKETAHPDPGRFSTLRGIATVKMTTRQIMALTRRES